MCSSEMRDTSPIHGILVFQATVAFKCSYENEDWLTKPQLKKINKYLSNAYLEKIM